MSFRDLVLPALIAGLIGALVMSALTLPWATSLILEAESYETAMESAGHHHDGEESLHHDEEWVPQDGMERAFYTVVADVLVGIGYALILGAFMALAGAQGALRGLLWGGAGFLVFFLLPALGLPPELPGTQSAELGVRQAWWLLTVICSAAGLALLAFGPGWGAKLLGAGLVLLPHLIGAPQPEIHHSAVPHELLQRFWLASAVTNLLFWLTLGSVLGRLYARGDSGKPLTREPTA